MTRTQLNSAKTKSKNEHTDQRPKSLWSKLFK